MEESTFSLFHESPQSNSDHQAWWQVPFPMSQLINLSSFFFHRKSKYAHDECDPKIYLAAVVLSLLSLGTDGFIVFWQMSLLCNLTRNFFVSKIRIS